MSAKRFPGDEDEFGVSSRLIKTAPELLAALKEAVSLIPMNVPGRMLVNKALREKFDAIIAKAEGKSK